MSDNAKLAQIFAQMGDIMDLLDENTFKVSAHRKVARTLEDLPEDAAQLARTDPAALRKIPGFGEGTVKKITEFAKTGAVQEHHDLLAQVPQTLLELLNVPGLGAKRIRSFWKDAGILDMATLRARVEDGSLAGLPGMGEKTVQKLRENLAFLDRNAGRARLGQALPSAEALIERLRAVAGTKRISHAGSLRRGRDTIGDIDIVASTTKPEALHESLRNAPNVAEVLASGETKTSVRLASGVQVDLRTVDDSQFGAALLYFTGSKEHNIKLRERAQKRKLRLNEYGLFPDDGKPAPQERNVKSLAGKTEEEIYRALEYDWVPPPELREDRGELDAPTPTTLIQLTDIRAELHSHTKASDGALTIPQHIEEAIRRGYRVLAITDHSRSSAQANGLSIERLREHAKAIRDAAKTYKDRIAVLAGSEVDILANGTLDYPDDVLAELDLVVASPHSGLKAAPEAATERLLAAIRNPFVHIIGHPTGRLINSREGLSPDIVLLAKEAKKHKTALEINANSMRLDLRDTHVRVCVETGTLIAIDTDAHTPADFDQLRYGIMTARRGGLPREQCVNTWETPALLKWLKSKGR